MKKTRNLKQFSSGLVIVSCSVKKCEVSVGIIQGIEFKGYLDDKKYFLKIGEIYCEKHKNYKKRKSNSFGVNGVLFSKTI